jgi:mannose-6-phosphate isomerase-like protein (cupin superfamily)
MDRGKKELTHVTREKMLTVIHGSTHPVPLSFTVNNDVCHMGEIVIPNGEGSRASEPDVHKGDAVFYVLSGPITLFLPETGDTFVAEDGQAMFLPEGTRYQCVNYESSVVKAIFLISPGI